MHLYFLKVAKQRQAAEAAVKNIPPPEFYKVRGNINAIFYFLLVLFLAFEYILNMHDFVAI
jgi:hypothetical protein